MPALAAIALFVVWATDQAGYPVTHWAPGGLIVLGLLAIALVAVRAAPARGRRCRCASRSACLGRLHGAQLPLDPVGGRTRGRLGRRRPHAALPARVRAVRVLAPARRHRRRCCSAVWTLAMIVLAAFVARCTSTPRGARAPRRPAPGRPPALPERLPERERGPVADGVLAGAAARAQQPAALARCAACSRAARCCSRTWRCSARAAARCTRRP